MFSGARQLLPRGARLAGAARPAARTAAATATFMLLAVGIAGCTSAFGSGPAHSVRQAQKYSRAITRLDISTGAGNITLSPGKGKRTTVGRRLEWSRKRPSVQQTWTGTILHITATCPDQGQCAVNFTITLPVAVAVHAQTGAGNVTISRLASGATITDNAGNVQLTGVSGSVDVTSQAGNVTGVRLWSGSVRVRGQAGKISLRFSAVPGTVSAITQAGPVLLVVPSAGKSGYRVAAHTQAGQRHVSVQLNSRSRHSLVARTNAGNVTVR
jgi:putative adhesin